MHAAPESLRMGDVPAMMAELQRSSPRRAADVVVRVVSDSVVFYCLYSVFRARIFARLSASSASVVTPRRTRVCSPAELGVRDEFPRDLSSPRDDPYRIAMVAAAAASASATAAVSSPRRVDARW